VRGRNISSIARDADVARSTIYDIISGESWPDLVSVFKLQTALGVRLWGIR
jgi:DNA-binding phage protein